VGSRVILELRQVEKRFGGVRAVDGVSFAMNEGEFAALIGPNGAGKSTLLALTAAALRCDAGSIRFAGAPLGATPAQCAQLGIGRTFQSAQVFTSMTLRENVLLALAARDRSSLAISQPLWPDTRAPGAAVASAADELLARVGLRAHTSRAASEIAYPDAKRLELAIALAGRPRLLLMDEPTAGMAAAERLALMDLVRALATQSRMSVLFTEHSMDAVFGYAQRVLVMARGKLIADGAPDAVRRDAAAQSAYFGALA